jgi:hypothetical protein
MKKNTWYDITNVDLFVESTRVLVYSCFGSNNEEKTHEIIIDFDQLDEEEKLEIDQCLPERDSHVIAKQYLRKFKNKKTNDIVYRISEKEYMLFIESLNARMISNMLQKLSSDGYLDSAFDTELNDFVFWVKNDEDNIEDKA